MSVRGERRLAYADFHTGYKKTRLAADELVQAVCLPRKFAGYFSHARKVGARNSQAISKVCIAGLGRVADGVVEDVRIALGSVAPVPLRLRETEKLLRGKVMDSNLLRVAKEAAIGEIQPIDDIRSTARYRAAVAGNLVVEFLNRFHFGQTSGEGVQAVLMGWNHLPADEAVRQVLPCCGSKVWAAEMTARRPFDNESEVLTASDEIWRSLAPADWVEAFESHPRIGESGAPSSTTQRASVQSVEWSAQEQRDAQNAEDEVKNALADANGEYEKRFQRIFIVCATGKSAGEILDILQRRLGNDGATELQEAAEQQRQITQIRLKKWLQE
jgi:2-oxo-4-hydroxy-4-carboxy-5-ureidoimidazoline decarboxylase